jgi:hypothetical protein
LADFVAKRFCAAERARLIQDDAPMRNVDSKLRAARFDRFNFLFHSLAAATFATLSALLGHAAMSAFQSLLGAKQRSRIYEYTA